MAHESSGVGGVKESKKMDSWVKKQKPAEMFPTQRSAEKMWAVVDPCRVPLSIETPIT
jgi:hypothetical protein